MICLCAINKDVIDYNNCTIIRDSNSTILVEPKNTISTKLIKDIIIGNLAFSICLYKSSKVSLIKNYLSIILSNS